MPCLEGYGNDFGIEHYEQLAAVMGSMKGRAILTINDHPDMRRIFAGFRRKRLGTTYTIGGGKKPAGELLITSWR